MLPFTVDEASGFELSVGDYIYIPHIREAEKAGLAGIKAYSFSGGARSELVLHLAPLTDEEKQIILDGCLMNYYAAGARREV